MLIVPDALLDDRFKGNPVVTGPPHVRFYAGMALISPEGYKLGDFCIWDTTPHPNGFSDEEKDSLRDLANMTVQVMVDRRFQLLERNRQENKQTHQESPEESEIPAQMLDSTAQALMPPLSGLQLALSLLMEDDDLQSALENQQRMLLNTAADHANV